MQEINQIECKNAAAFVQMVRVVWNGGGTYWSPRYITSKSKTIDLSRYNIPDGTEVWVEVRAILRGKMESNESTEHVLYSSKSLYDATYCTKGIMQSFKVELMEELKLNELKAKELKEKQLEEKRLIEEQLKRERLREEKRREMRDKAELVRFGELQKWVIECKSRIDEDDFSKYGLLLGISFTVTNAGLCQLKKYFLHLFLTLGYLDKNNRRFINTASQIRAVFAMQYMTRLEEKTYNQMELVFNRFFVSLPISIKLPEKLELTNEEKNEIERLINTVIESEMKKDDTPVKDILKNSILRRGQMIQKEDKWVLTIEDREEDILFESNPLSLSRIDCPWLVKDIEVVWHK